MTATPLTLEVGLSRVEIEIATVIFMEANQNVTGHTTYNS